MSGQRVPRVTMTPFSVEKLSEGSPWMFQSRTFLGSARNSAKSKFSDAGMCSALTCRVQSLGDRVQGTGPWDIDD